MVVHTVTDVALEGWVPSFDGRDRVRGLVIAWCADGPDRVGEIALLPPGKAQVLGRGAEGEARVAFVRQRPGRQPAAAPLDGKGISREQLRVRATDRGVQVERLGRCRMSVNGHVRDEALLCDGDTLLLKNQLLLVCVSRTAQLPALRDHPDADELPFGAPDRFGIVGESEVAWALRERLATIASTDEHVLVLGPSGAGKELAARTIHGLSRRGRRPLVARNAATLPEGLIDAELFGNAAGYPNAGQPERSGLIGEAHGSTLFLDEIAELREALQAHLLRVLDGGGEYHRLGDGAARRSDLRLVAATNRDPESLKHDILARLTLRVELPGLGDRPEDIALVARHVIQRACDTTPSLRERYGDPSGEPRVSPELLDALVRHRYTHHVRELSGLLWAALSSSDGNFVALTDELRARLETVSAGSVVEADLDADAVRAALHSAAGNRTRAAEALGLPSRFALYRLIKKFGL